MSKKLNRWLAACACVVVVSATAVWSGYAFDNETAVRSTDGKETKEPAATGQETVSTAIRSGDEPVLGCCNHDSLRGDVNYDNVGPDTADLNYLSDYLYASGEEPECFAEADVYADGFVNIVDYQWLESFLMAAGFPPYACGESADFETRYGGRLFLSRVSNLYHSQDKILAGAEVTMFIGLYNDQPEPNIRAVTNGFRIYSPTGAQWNATHGSFTGTLIEQLDGHPTIIEQSTDGSGTDIVGFLAYDKTGGGLWEKYRGECFTITIGPIDPYYHGDTICIDSSFVSPVHVWVWSAPGKHVFPDWTGPHCFEVSTLLDAEFSAEPTAGQSPLVVNFTSLIAGNPTSYRWDFGDGATALDVPNPAHTYEPDTAAVYDVRLIVEDAYGHADTVVKPAYILVDDSLFVDLRTQLAMSPWGNGPGQEVRYWCSWANLGTDSAHHCTLLVSLPPEMDLNAVLGSLGNPIGDYSLSGNDVFVPLGTVVPSAGWQSVTMLGTLSSVPASDSVLIAEVLLSSQTPDVNLANNYAVDYRTVQSDGKGERRRQDPTALKSGDLGGGLQYYRVEKENPLTYTIRFEHPADGAGNINYVRILDTLDANLDCSERSLNILATSHPEVCYSHGLQYSPEGVPWLEWFFDGIQLPPNQQPPEGEGYVIFQLYPRQNVDSGTVIENLGKVRFDYDQEWVQAPEYGPLERVISPDCCMPPRRGNVNYDPMDETNIVDVTWLVAYLFAEGAAPPCLVEADVNFDGTIENPLINIVDLTYVISYLFGGGPRPFPCHKE